MRIVNIEDYFHPSAGYQINIMPKFLASFGHDVTIVTSQMDVIPDFLTKFFGTDVAELDAEYTRKTGVKIVRLPMYAYKSGRAINKPGLFKRVAELKPDMLYIHGESSFIAMQYLLRYRRLKHGLIFDSHMHDDAVANKFAKPFHLFFRMVFAPIFRKYNLKVIRTQNSHFIEDYLGIPLAQSPWLSFGSDTKIFRPDAQIRAEFRKAHNIAEDDFVVVYAGKQIKDKGADFFAETIRPKMARADGGKIVFMAVGNSPSGEYGARLDSLYAASENRVIRFPTQKYADLHTYFQAADLAVFPNEGSLTFYDAQACALPVLWSDEKLNVERLRFGNGFNFKIFDKADFAQKILKCANMPNEEYAQMRANALKYIEDNYDYEKISRQYESFIIEEYNRQKSEKHF